MTGQGVPADSREEPSATDLLDGMRPLRARGRVEGHGFALPLLLFGPPAPLAPLAARGPPRIPAAALARPGRPLPPPLAVVPVRRPDPAGAAALRVDSVDRRGL